MCLQALAPIFAAIGGGGTAAGATAAAGGFGKALTTVGTLVSAGGSLAQGLAARNAGRAQAAAIEDRMRTEAALTATEDQRTRGQFRSQIRQQAAELAGRGIALSSPTAVLLGQTAAREMSFASQAVRSRGGATQRELSWSRQAALARGSQGLLRGSLRAAGTVLTAAPEIWPGLAG